MAPILTTVLTEIMKSLNSEEGIKPKVEGKKKDFSLDSDSDSAEDFVGFDIDNSFIDEKAAAIHALGNIALNCSSLVFPHMAQIIASLQEMCFYVHENIRYHVCLTLTQIGFGLQRHFSNQPDSDEPFEWVAGLPAKNQLRPEVLDFLKTYLYPHFGQLFQ